MINKVLKIYFLVVILLTISLTGFPQKPGINFDAYSEWPSLGDYAISNNGLYLMYVNKIWKQHLTKDLLIVQSSDGKWKKEFENVNHGMFADDNRTAFFKTKGDSLCILKLNSQNVTYIPDVTSYKTPKENQNLIAFKLKDDRQELILQNLLTGDKKSFYNVANYTFDNKGKTLLLEIDSHDNGSIVKELQWVNLLQSSSTIIWKGEKVENCTFSDQYLQLVFFGKNRNEDAKDNTIYYFKEGMDKATVLVNNRAINFNKKLQITNEQLSFNKDGTCILFSLKEPFVPLYPKTPIPVNINIWSSKDEYLQSEQLSPSFHGESKTKFIAAISLYDKKNVILLDDEKINFNGGGNNTNYVLGFRKDLIADAAAGKSNLFSLILISLKNGTKKVLTDRQKTIDYLGISPDENFVIWFDRNSMILFSYEIKTGIKTNISKDISYPIYDEDAAKILRYGNFGIAGWSKNDHSVWLYDRYDLWKVDLIGIKKPVNITNGYGRKNKIVFGIANNPASLNTGENLLLAGYNDATKENGFWTIKATSGGDPQKGNMEPYCYYIPRVGKTGNVEYPSGFMPLKAKDANCWLVRRENASESPNLCITTDFKSFKRISNIQPEKKYNWLTTELIKWKMTDGQMSQGILYKPENFDSTKKYPLIFDYYEKRSDELNKYIKPDFSYARINIPTYVSNGYLVFVPDIYYVPGNNGKGVVNAVASAAKYLCKYSWVDSAKLGLQGHSFGGWETNYLITHSNLFAAACEASGVSDQISAYDQISLGTGTDRQTFYEKDSQGSPYGEGITPWTKTDVYSQNSPVLAVQNVTTPLLMMHGDSDPSVPFAQAIEMFLALKRAGKKAWLLQYEKAAHTLAGENAKDYTIRMRQFFDYYLKDFQPPIWMTIGVPASSKGFETGYVIDQSGKTP